MSGVGLLAGERVSASLRRVNGPASLAAECDGAPFAVAVAVTEHVLGVLPLLALFPDEHPMIRAIRDGGLPTALAVFTPNAELTWSVPTVRGRWSGGGAVLTGRFQVAAPMAAALVAVAFPDATRLCAVPLAHTGWSELEARPVERELVSQRVSWAERAGPLRLAVDEYASAYVGLVHRYAAGALAELRRDLAATPAEGPVFAESQLLAHELTRLDIELSLLGAASRLGPREVGPGLLAAATGLAARTARMVADRTAELGLPARTSPPSGTAFGGKLMVESELARDLGLLREPA